MQNIQETLVRQFWSHVFSSPDKPAVLVKNEGPRQSQFIAGGGVRFGAPSVVTVKAPAMRPLSFKDVGHIVSEFMAFLSDNGFKKGDRAAILSWNRPEWVWCDLAIQSLGGITVPIYPNSSAEQVAYIVQDAGASFLFVEHDEQLDDLTAAIAPDLNVYQTTFSEVMAAVPDYTGRTLPQPKFNEPIQPLKLEFSRRSSLRLKQVRWQYIASFNPRATSPFLGLDPQDVATIIYTSGSTGVPKGAVLTHRNIASSCQALMRHGFDFTPQDVYLSYLPLAHVYERVNGQAMCIWNAVPVAFCRVDELGDALKLVQPTILLGVPAVWRKMKDKIES
ncbi:MAG TPA: AMP-binding protein, partial [Chroococcales cyanobacterium]